MRLDFETQPHLTINREMPLLVNHDGLQSDNSVKSVSVDGEVIALDEQVVTTFQEVVATMNTEKLPERHYRDCVHFVMAMSGVWLPTHRPFDPGMQMKQVCQDKTSAKQHLGPVATGIPNDERCLGFGNARYVYSHSALGISTSKGIMYLQKLGSKPLFSLSTADQVLHYYDHEVVHPILELSIRYDDSSGSGQLRNYQMPT